MFQILFVLFIMWFWATDLKSKLFLLIAAFVILLPVQLLLCFKVKNFLIRLIPILLSIAFLIYFFIRSVLGSGWDEWLYASISGFMAFICFIGWTIWAVADDKKIERSKKKQ